MVKFIPSNLHNYVQTLAQKYMAPLDSKFRQENYVLRKSRKFCLITEHFRVFYDFILISE